MRFSRILLVLGIAAIPLWYVYRTLEEKRVRHLEWSEVFMTEDARRAKWAEDEKNAREAAEAAKVKAATDLAQSITARKNAEAEAAKADAEAVRMRNQEAAETARRQIEVSTQVAAAETARVRAESERAARQQRIAARVALCNDAALAAEHHLRELLDEQKRYKAFVAESAAVPISLDQIRAEKFAKTFRWFEWRSFVKSEEGLNDIRNQKDACLVAANDESMIDGSRLRGFSDDITRLESNYERDMESLQDSRSTIQDLIDFATGQLPKTIGGEVKRSRIQKALDESYNYK